MAYNVGSLVSASVIWQQNGVTLDPSGTITCKYRDPLGTLTTLVYPTGITKVTTGVYSVTINANISGRWRIRWESTGTGQATVDSAFDVAPSDLA